MRDDDISRWTFFAGRRQWPLAQVVAPPSAILAVDLTAWRYAGRAAIEAALARDLEPARRAGERRDRPITFLSSYFDSSKGKICCFERTPDKCSGQTSPRSRLMCQGAMLQFASTSNGKSKWFTSYENRRPVPNATVHHQLRFLL
jgi:hypothetical protein